MHRRTLLVGAVTVSGGCLSAATPTAPQPREAEDQTTALLNDLRAAAGVERVPSDETLTEAARAHAQDMAERDFFAHVNPDGEQPWERVPCRAAENIARSPIDHVETEDGETWYTREPDEMAGFLARGWKLSDPHYQNLTKPDHRKQGVGIYVTEDRDEFFAVSMFC